MSLDTGFYKEPKYNLGDYVWEDTNRGLVSKMLMNLVSKMLRLH